MDYKPAIDSVNDYEAWKRKWATHDARRAAVVLGEAKAVSPDDHAASVELGKAFNIPTGVAAEGKDMLNARQATAQQGMMLQRSPVLSRWLQDIDNSRVAQDDIDNLSWYEGFFRGVGNTAERASARIMGGVNTSLMSSTAQRYADKDKSFGQLVDDSASKIGGVSYPVLSDVIAAGARYADARFAEMIGTDDKANAQYHADQVARSRKWMESAPQSFMAQSFLAGWKKADAPVEAFANFGHAVAANPLGAVALAFETLGESAPQMMAGLAATLTTKSPAAGIGVSGATVYATEKNTSVPDFLRDAGIDLARPADVDRMLADPKILEEANNRGMIRGAIVTAFDMLSMGFAGRSLAANPMVEAIAQAAQQAITGSLGEYSAMVASGQKVDLQDVILEGAVGIAGAPVEMGIAGRKLINARKRAKVSDAMGKAFDGLMKQSAKSALKNRPGGKFEEFMAAAARGSGLETVQVPADAVRTLFQDGADLPFLADLGVSESDYRAALATGGDVTIRTSAYAAKVAGTPFDDQLREHLRFEPDGMTAAEVKTFNEAAQDALVNAFEESEAARLSETEMQSHEQQIYDTMYRGSGRRGGQPKSPPRRRCSTRRSIVPWRNAAA